MLLNELLFTLMAIKVLQSRTSNETSTGYIKSFDGLMIQHDKEQELSKGDS